MRMLSAALAWACFGLGLVPTLNAQAAYTATRRVRVQIGVGGLYLHTDFTPAEDEGVADWVDVDFARHVGIEGKVQFGSLRTPDAIGERSYFLGPRVRFARGRLNVFGTAGLGQGTISNRLLGTFSTYNLANFGGGAEWLVERHWNLRLADVEVARWLGFPPNGLTPVSLVAGASYVLP